LGIKQPKTRLRVGTKKPVRSGTVVDNRQSVFF
jgi:hypothetical protein